MLYQLSYRPMSKVGLTYHMRWPYGNSKKFQGSNSKFSGGKGLPPSSSRAKCLFYDEMTLLAWFGLVPSKLELLISWR